MTLRTSGSPRRPALWAGAAAAIGIWLAAYGSAYPWLLAATAGISVVLILASIRDPASRGLWLYILIAAAAALHLIALNSWRPAYDLKYHTHSNEPVLLYGVVSAEPDIRPHVSLVYLGADSVRYSDSTVRRRGGVLLRLSPEVTVQYGEYLVVRGLIEPIARARNAGEFDYAAYMARRDIFVELTGDHGPLVVGRDPDAGLGWTASIVAPLRAWILDRITRHIHGDPAALIMGLMFGERKQLDHATLRQFQDTGTLHLLAVSGSNVAVVIGVVWSMLALLRAPRTVRIAITLIALLLFCALSRNQPSVVRASVAAALVLLGHAGHRRIDPLNIWGGSLLLILMASPAQLFDIGFQLSFAAALGIIVFAPTFARWSSGHTLTRRLARIAGSAIGVSIVAQLAVTPILAATFNRIPSVTPLSNLACVPIAGIATAAGLVTLIAAPLGESVLTFMAGVTWVFTELLLRAVALFDRIGLPVLKIASPSIHSVVLYYAAVCLIAAWLLRPSWWRRVLFGLVLVANLAVWPGAFTHDTEPQIIVLDCGAAAVSLVRWPSGEVWLIEQRASRSTGHFTRVVDPFLRRNGWEPPGLLWLLDGNSSLTRLHELWPSAASARRDASESTLSYIEDRPSPARFRLRVTEDPQSHHITSLKLAGGGGEIIWLAPNTAFPTSNAPSDSAATLCLVAAQSPPEIDSLLFSQHIRTAILSAYPGRTMSAGDPPPNVHSLSTLSCGGIRIWGMADSLWTESSIR